MLVRTAARLAARRATVAAPSPSSFLPTTFSSTTATSPLLPLTSLSRSALTGSVAPIALTQSRHKTSKPGPSGANAAKKFGGAGAGASSSSSDSRSVHEHRRQGLSSNANKAGAAASGSAAGSASGGARYDSAQEEFASAETPESNRTEPTENKDGTEGKEAGEKQQDELPDLRQGIPSTFAAEFGVGEAARGREKATETTGQGVGQRQPEGQQERGIEDSGTTATGEEEAAARESGGGPGAGRGPHGREGELPKSAYETSADRRRNQMANWMYASMAFFLLTGVAYLGRAWDTDAEAAAHPDVPSGWSPSAMYARASARLASQMGYYTEPTFPKLLPDMGGGEKPPTLVISLEDLMVHSEWSREHGWRMPKRPGVDYFLRYLSQYYELVVFTSLPMQTADPIIRKLDPFHIIMWPLFREATRYEKGEYIKDLSYLNRDLSKVILVDTNPSHARNQPENAIILPPWKGDPRDKSLVALIPFLEYAATMGVSDVRKLLASFPHLPETRENKSKSRSTTMIPAPDGAAGAEIPTPTTPVDGTTLPVEFAQRESRARAEFEKQLAEWRAKRPKHSGASWLAGALGLKPANMSLMVPVGGEESAAEAFTKGKMPSDVIRERGQRQYEMLEKDIRENGEKWLREMAEEEKRLQEEQMKSWRGSMGLFGGGGQQGGQQEEKK
ncbi:hypothetical protein BDY21DRAFT_414697 [Lineolata rhizophorae]|uniref:Mitochondrial import inner membrane translocase subunit TIM50 n=1 Tax=Lineolata rhizophorae TaxID=578093 RepID=A0A6A6P3L0_9PEZI|nr:hypothetical protein BDY21DRAFT_414697 [Lineolata rhizophorae]